MSYIKALRQEIITDLREHRIKLPNIPDVMVRIREALMGDGKSFEQIGRIVQLDPGLCSRLIQVANSPQLRGLSKIDTPQAAVSWLGLQAVRNLATSLALKNAYQGKDPRVRRLLNSVWTQSCRVSAISHVLGSVTVGLKADKALLAGMVHNIGVLPFVNYLDRYPQLLGDEERLGTILQQLQGRLGSLLLRHWQFEEDVYTIPLIMDNPQYESGNNKPNYADIVLVAKVHSRFGHPGGEEALGVLPTMPSFLKLPIRHLGPSGSLEILERSEEDIDALMELLKG